MPYQADFLCTYKQMYDEEVQHLLYQIQLLQAFNVNSFSGQEIEEEISELTTTLMTQSTESKLFITTVLTSLQDTSDAHLKSLVQLCKQTDLDNDVNDFLVTMLFRFECFDLFHKCLCELFNSGNVSSPSLEALLSELS